MIHVVVALAVFFGQGRPVSAAEPPVDKAPPAPVAVIADGQPMSLTLPDALQLAFQRQPRLAAQRSSLAAAQDGARAVEQLLVPDLIDPELPYRRRQGCLGITAATAGLDQVERETTYAVTRTYMTILYARQQLRVAQGIVDRLSAIQTSAKRQLDAGARDVTAVDVNRATVYLRLAQAKVEQARTGNDRALAALKEAIGLDQDAPLDVPSMPLPVPSAQPNRAEVVGYALSRRGEVIKASVFEQVTCLEVEAQGSRHVKRMQTFAAGSDIHAVPVPQGTHNTEYRPGGVAPEMPTLLAGERRDRVRTAEDYHARAVAALDATRKVIELEAVDTFLRWQEAARGLPGAREAADTGDKLADDLNKDYTAGVKSIKIDDVINSRVLAATARSQYNEQLYKEILALIDLERITAGGFAANLLNTPVAEVRSTPH
jgi:outer membrane protein TolC